MRICWREIAHVYFLHWLRLRYMLCAVLSSRDLLYKCMHLGYQFRDLERLRHNVVLLVCQYTKN